MMKKNKILLLLLALLATSACKRELELEAQYLFKYPFTNLCSGGLTQVYVPNSFNYPGIFPLRWAPEFMFLFNDSVCANNLNPAPAISSYRLVVFDMNNTIFFSTTDPLATWDGRWKNIRIPSGRYFWKMNFTDFDGVIREEKGSVHLVY